ncbi:MAG: outer membrane protein, OmpA/MotB family [Deltaproteobacteria bacterium]|nr:outer membrane protein, OmpA/MotB family [Deltaproteobacteria bacterium]
MDDDHKAPVRIVVKKKKGHGGHHGGAWKVAYADFVTAMMALFIVLWIVGQSNAVKNAISAYFKDPTVFTQGTGGAGILPDGAPKQQPSPTVATPSEMETLKAEGKKIEDAISATPAFSKFKDKVQVTVTKDGLRVELVENATGLFFDVGSAQVKAETIQLLAMIAAEIGKLPNRVIIEGYTDARPYTGAGYSNWELSTERANTARKILEEKGLKKDQVSEVRGFADRNLKHPDKPMDASNRRVSILVATSQFQSAEAPPVISPPEKVVK